MKTKLDKIDRAFAEGKPIDDAINRGIREAMIIHKRLGQAIVTWQNGQVVWIPAEEIPTLAISKRRRRATHRRAS